MVAIPNDGYFIAGGGTGGDAENGPGAVILGNGVSDITVGGTTTAARNVISGNYGDGVLISGGSTLPWRGGRPANDGVNRDNTVEGNYIGINANGNGALPNATTGIDVAGVGPEHHHRRNRPGRGQRHQRQHGQRRHHRRHRPARLHPLYLKADGNATNTNYLQRYLVANASTVGGVTYGPGITGQAFRVPRHARRACRRSRRYRVLGQHRPHALGLDQPEQPARSDALRHRVAGVFGHVGDLRSLRQLRRSARLRVVFRRRVPHSDLQRRRLGSRLGTFQQVAVTTDGSTVTFYVNGVAVGSSAMPVPLDITANGDLEIGGLAQGPNLFNGLIDDLSFTISPLPADEIARIYANAGQGTDLGGSGTEDTTVTGNLIGTNPAGTSAIANGADGVEINDALNNTIGGTAAGAGNTIAYNSGDGVQVVGNRATGNAIRGDSIHDNTGLGIELGSSGVPSVNVLGGAGTGPNLQENDPVLTSVAYTAATGTTISGNINGPADTVVIVDLYTLPTEPADGYGQGNTYLGSVTVTTSLSGNASFTFNAPTLPPNAIVSATATDAAGNTSEFSADAAEDNPPVVVPLAKVHAGDTTGATTFNEGQTVHFDGTGSSSPDGDPLTYSWDFGDGSAPVAGATPTHAYAYDGNYVVTLTANDGHGGIETNTLYLTINKLAPSVTINAPPSAVVGAPFTLNGTIDDPTNDLETVVITWGDGTSPTTLSLPAGTTTFSAPHTYLSALPAGATSTAIGATVTDASNPAAPRPETPLVPPVPPPTFDVGGLSATTSAAISVVQNPPTFNAGSIAVSPTVVHEGNTATISGTITDANPTLSHTITVTWGDPNDTGTSSVFLPPGVFSFSASHLYRNNPVGTPSGAFSVNLTVTNSNGLSGTLATSVTVYNVAPTVRIHTLPLQTTGSVVSLVADVTDPGTLDNPTYAWTVTPAGGTPITGSGQTFSFTSAAGGVYQASVTVTDDDFATGSYSTQVLVGPSSPSNAIVFSPSGAGA